MMMDSSPYHRPELTPTQQTCPNCGLISEQEDMQRISIQSIIKHFRRNDELQKQQLLKGQPSNVEQLEAALSATDTNWASLPPVLQRLKRPAHSLEAGKLGEKVVRICSGCFESFTDGAPPEVLPQEKRRAEVAARRRQQIREAPKMDERTGLPTFGQRKANRKLDMVFSDSQENLRNNDLALARKRRWRTNFVMREAERLEWSNVPAPAKIVKEMRNVALSRLADHDPTVISRTDTSLVPDWGAPEHSAASPASRHRGSMDLVPVGRQSHPPASIAGGTTGPRHGMYSSHANRTLDLGGSLFEEATSPATGVESLTRRLDIDEASGRSIFEVDFADRLQFELWTEMTAVCQFSKLCPEGVEDITVSSPYFEQYRKNRNRFPNPTHSDIVSDATLVSSESFCPLLTEDLSSASRAEEVLKKTEAVLSGLDDLTSAEASLLRAVVGSEDPRESDNVDLDNLLLDGDDMVVDSASDEEFVEEDEEMSEDGEDDMM